MLDLAEEWDEATHHAVENRAINRPNFRGEGGGRIFILRKAFGCS
jgi:hypothetical protein